MLRRYLNRFPSNNKTNTLAKLMQCMHTCAGILFNAINIKLKSVPIHKMWNCNGIVFAFTSCIPCCLLLCVSTYLKQAKNKNGSRYVSVQWYQSILAAVFDNRSFGVSYCMNTTYCIGVACVCVWNNLNKEKTEKMMSNWTMTINFE